MNKVRKIAGLIGVILIVSSMSAFAAVQVSESTLVVSDDYEVSYEVQPTDDVFEFLADNGIDIYGETAKEISFDLDLLRDVDVDDDGEFTMRDSLNTLVNSALFEARADGYDAVFMELGNTRWIMYTEIED